MKPCSFKGLQVFLKSSALAFNLHLILPGVSCQSHDGAKFTTQASEMERRVPREFADPVFVSVSSFGRELSFGGFGATVVRPPCEHSGQRGEPNP